MGKRCRWAALGATFALLVAACAATNRSSSSTVAPSGDAVDSSTGSTTVADASASAEAVRFPDSLADTSFVTGEAGEGPCAAGDASQVLLIDPTDGSTRWSFPIPRPGTQVAVAGSTAFVATSWDQGQSPGIAAIDLADRSPSWQRFLSAEPEAMHVTDTGLLVATRDDIRSIDPASGDDRWVLDSQFDFGNAVLGNDYVFAMDSVGVHAIDAATGDAIWQLAIERPDSLAADESTLIVAAGTRFVGVDIEERSRLWDIDVDRLGAGDLHVATPEVVLYELSTTVAPGGGIAALDRNSGAELWRSTTLGEPRWAGTSTLVSSTANDEPAPGAPFVLFGLDVATGDRRWQTPATAQAFQSVIAADADRILTSEPHPAVPGLRLVRLLDPESGEQLWSTTTDEAVDGASMTGSGVISLYGSRTGLGADRGVLVTRNRAGNWWTASTPDGIASTPMQTPYGLFVVSGERSLVCVARQMVEPRETTEVLGASVDRDD